MNPSHRQVGLERAWGLSGSPSLQQPRGWEIVSSREEG